MIKKRLLSLFLAALLFTMFSACGSNSSQDSSNNKDSSSELAGGKEDPNYPGGVSLPGKFPITKEKTELNVIIKSIPSQFTDITTNEFTKELEEYTNVHLNMNVIAEDSYQEKLNLLLNSGEYPEVIMSGGFDGNSDLVKYGMNEGILIPINDLIEEHGYNIKNLMKQFPYLEEDMTLSDGKIYGIPELNNAGEGHTQCTYKAWANKEWMDKLKIEMPETTEDFRNMLLAFKNNDPNGNGKADEIPMTGASNSWATDVWLYLLNAFGYFDDWNFFSLKDGIFTPVLTQDYLQEGLTYIKELYDEGLIDPASFTQTEQQMAAIGANENAVIGGVATCGHLGMFVSPNDTERAPMYTTLLPLKGPNGYRGIPYSTETHVQGAVFTITDKCKNPAVAFKLADCLMDEYMMIRRDSGIKDVDWTEADPDTLGMDGTTAAKYKRLTAQETTGQGTMSNDKWGGACNLISPNLRVLWQFDGDIFNPINYEARLYQETIKLKPYAADNDSYPPLMMEDDVSIRYNEIKTQVGDYRKTAFVEFITGKKSLETEWDAYLADLDKLGYAEYIKITQDTYDAQISNK